MGFDIYGEQPTEEIGEYFRNSVWWWKPLWQYICQIAANVLTEKDKEMGWFNDGHLIDKQKAEQIAALLHEEIKSDRAEMYVVKYMDTLKALPKETCDICKGTGTRNDQYVQGTCNACHGEGKRTAWASHYPINLENIADFAEFCAASGGFTIC